MVAARFRKLLDAVSASERGKADAEKQSFVRRLQCVLDAIFSRRAHLRREFQIMLADPLERELFLAHYDALSAQQIASDKDRTTNAPSAAAKAVKSKIKVTFKCSESDHAKRHVFWWGSRSKRRTKIELRERDMSVGSKSFAYDKIQSLSIGDTSSFRGDACPPSECCLSIGTQKGVVLLEADSRADRDFWTHAIAKKKRRMRQQRTIPKCTSFESTGLRSSFSITEVSTKLFWSLPAG